MAVPVFLVGAGTTLLAFIIIYAIIMIDILRRILMPAIPKIRPVSDLRNKFSDISKAVHESNEPVYLTRNGRGDMVVMSLEAYEKNLFETEIYLKLKEAEYQAASVKKRYTHDEAMNELRKIISKKETPNQHRRDLADE